MKKLRIIPQRMPHDDLIIEGNTEGIRRLKELLTYSLDEATGASVARFTSRENTFLPPDGEGYFVTIRTLETWPDDARDYYSEWA